MSQFRVSPRARADLDEIWRYIARDSVDRANRFADEITSRFPMIARFPGMGDDKSRFGAGLRSLPVGKYLIFYRATSRPLEIVRILHGARDLPSIFRPNDS